MIDSRKIAKANIYLNSLENKYLFGMSVNKRFYTEGASITNMRHPDCSEQRIKIVSLSLLFN